MNDDPYADRRRLTFEQAEGVEPLPRQMQPRELSQELRAVLWAHIYESMLCDQVLIDDYIDPEWQNILYNAWIVWDREPADEYRGKDLVAYVKTIIMKQTYVRVLGFIQIVLRHSSCPPGLSNAVNQVLEQCRSAYRVLDKTTIVPIASDHDADTVQRAFSDLEKQELHGARKHLRSAGSHLTSGDYAASIRESIHAVESVVCLLSDSSDLKKAMNKLGDVAPIHGALKNGFLAIYGYTSDERGIRHSLLDQREAPVDEADALFMLGACAAFVSYLINKARNAGLLERKSIDEVAKNVDGRNECGHDGE
jgi:hypothetical protein